MEKNGNWKRFEDDENFDNVAMASRTVKQSYEEKIVRIQSQSRLLQLTLSDISN